MIIFVICSWIFRLSTWAPFPDFLLLRYRFISLAWVFNFRLGCQLTLQRFSCTCVLLVIICSSHCLLIQRPVGTVVSATWVIFKGFLPSFRTISFSRLSCKTFSLAGLPSAKYGFSSLWLKPLSFIVFWFRLLFRKGFFSERGICVHGRILRPSFGELIALIDHWVMRI